MPGPTPTSPTASAPHSDRRRWVALGVVCLGMFMITIDASIVNVALPAIQRQLHLSQADLTWVVNAFLITFGSCLLLAGRLGDLIGRRRVFLLGLAVFTVSSALCGLAGNPDLLIAGRFLQGIGAALTASAVVALIVTEFPRADERAKAMSAYIFVAVGGGSLGLLVGGILTQTISWHWIFFINVPIGIVTFLLGRVLIRENVGLGLGRGVDWAGSLMITVALMVGIYAIVEVTSYGWLSVHTLVVGGASAALLVGFVVLESRLANPIVPLRIFRIPTLTRSSIIRGLLNTGMFSTFFLGALYLQNVIGYTPIQTGLAFLPTSLSMAVLSAGITARLMTRFGPKRVLLPGMVAATVGLLLLSRLGVQVDYWTQLFPAYLLLGLGAGCSFLPLLSIAMRDVPEEDAGLGSGVVNVSMQVAAAVGLAVLGTVASNRSRVLLASGAAPRSALTGGYHLAYLIAAACTAVGTVTAVVLLGGPRQTAPDPAERQHLAVENAGEPGAT
jgi:EmrB/QacA subfamily drug resistance transporter